MVKHKYIIIVLSIISLLIVIAAVAWYIFRPVISVDEKNLDKFITSEVVQLEHYTAISTFRSGLGHDFSGGGETCRSMKHYFLPKKQDSNRVLDDASKIPHTLDPKDGLAIKAPFDGEITQIQSEQHPLGKQIFLRPHANPSYIVRLFHIYPLDSIQPGSKVTAGQRIGSVLPYQQTDIAVQVLTLTGLKYFSYFDVMTDEVFAAYKARKIPNKDSLIMTRESRDAKPLTCSGEQFTTEPPVSDWVYLDGARAPILQENSNNKEY